MIPDFTLAATAAAESLIKYNICTAPVSPLPILSRMNNVVVISFQDLSESSGMNRRDLIPLFGKCSDAITSVHTESGHPYYVVAYNSLLPFNIVQRALAREMGHIVLNHEGSSELSTAEANCFAHHFLCPRPLIHAIEATKLRLTVDLLANITGVFDQSLYALRRVPGTDVSAGLNRFVRNQFMPFVLNFFEYYQTVLPSDGSALADFGSFMDGYVE